MASTSGTSPGPTKLRMARPYWVMSSSRAPSGRWWRSSQELPVGVQPPQYGQLVLRRTELRAHALGHDEVHGRLIPHLLHRHAGEDGVQAHAPRARLEVEDAERGD